MELPSGPEGEVEVAGRRVAVTSLDRVLWPGEAFAKRDLLAYYLGIAPVLLPHIRRRPLSLGRFPEGVAGRGFLQNECRGAPAWMATAALRLQSGSVRRYCLVDDAAALLWVANLGTVELHPYPAPVDRPGEPVAVLFDLDPGLGTTLLDACDVALELRADLATRGLDAVAKTSGASGLHVSVPVQGARFDRVRSFARETARRLAARRPGAIADPAAHMRQPGRILVDWRQNAERRSTVAAYSLRATVPLSVSMPVRWSEIERALERRDAASLQWSPRDVAERVARHGDLYAAPAQPLPR